MERRSFLSGTLAGGAVLGAALGPGASSASASQAERMLFTDDLVVERDQPGRPHEGKVLAAIQPHADDIPIFAAGTVAKLIREGYTGYLINVTNDDHAGPGTVGDTVVANEDDVFAAGKALGFKKVYWLGYRNHQMEDIHFIEMKARLIFLFRLLQVDTVIGYDPYGLYEENPDHWMTARVVEAACWMAGGGKDYPEHFKAGLKPHGVREKYYHARGIQHVNRVVDITSTVDARIDSNVANLAQGPAGNAGVRLRDQLAKEGKRIPAFSGDDLAVNRAYVREFLLEEEKALGKRHGLAYAEAFHYIGPGSGYTPTIREYIEKNATAVK